MGLEVRKVAFENVEQGQQLVELLNAYAEDPMGGAEPLSAEVKANLVKGLSQVPGALALLAYLDGQAVGVTTAFAGFSTFAAKPLLNIHDIAVLPAFRGQGVAQALMAGLEQEARERGCCKMTLEVLSNNHRAQQAYRRFGFAGYALDPEAGEALFWQKKL
jgi:ribosomal protein S18 acetylase RimI-like enzyme